MASENKLYKALSSGGFYTKTQSDFESQFATPEAQTKLYNKLKESEYYTKDENSFKQQFFSPIEEVTTPAPPSVNIPPAPPVAEEIQGMPSVNIPMFGNVTPQQMESAPAMQIEEKTPLTLPSYQAMEMEKEVAKQEPIVPKMPTSGSDVLQGYKTEGEQKAIEGNIIEKKAKQDAAQFAMNKNDFDKQSGADIDAIHVADSLYKKINSGEITDKDEIKNFNDVILPQAKAQEKAIDNNYVQWGLNNIADKTQGNKDAKLAGLANNYFKALSPDSETLGDEYDILDKIHQLDPTWQPDMSLLNPKNEQLRKEQYQNNVVYYNQKKRDYNKAVQNAINDSRDLHNEQDVKTASVGLLAGYDNSLERFKKAQAELGDAGNALKSSYQSYILKKNIGQEFEESQIPYLSPIANLAKSFLGGVVKDIVPAVQKEGMGITTSTNTLPEQQRLALIQEEQQKQYKEKGVTENENIQPSISEKVGGLGGEMTMFLGRQAILAPFIETGLNSGAALVGLKNIMGEAGIASNLMQSKSLGAKTLGVFAHGLEEGTKMALSTGDSEQFKMGAEFGIAGQLGKALPILIKGNPFLTGAIKTMVGSGSTVAGVEAYKLAEASANYMMNQDDFNESLKKSGIDADNLNDYSKQKIAETLVFGILGLKEIAKPALKKLFGIKESALDRLDRINKIREDLKKNGVPEQEIESIVNPSNDLIMANAVKIGKELGSETPIAKLPQADQKVAISLHNELERIKARYEGKVDESKPLADQISPEDMKRVDEIHNQLMSLKNKYFKPTIPIDNSANEPATTGTTTTTSENKPFELDLNIPITPAITTTTEAAPTKKPSLSESILGELEQEEAPQVETAPQPEIKPIEIVNTPTTNNVTETTGEAKKVIDEMPEPVQQMFSLLDNPQDIPQEQHNSLVQSAMQWIKESRDRISQSSDTKEEKERVKGMLYDFQNDVKNFDFENKKKQPKVETTTEAPAKEPVAETPIAETPQAEAPIPETPTIETPVAETPKVETPVAGTKEAEGKNMLDTPTKAFSKATDLLGDPREKWMYEATESERDKAAQERARSTMRGSQYYPKKITQIKFAIDGKKYEKAIAEGRMTAKDAKQIIESAGLQVPKEILDKAEQTKPAETTEKISAEKPIEKIVEENIPKTIEQTLADDLAEAKSLPRKTQIKKATNKLIDKHFENIFAQMTLKEPNKYKRIC
jgi:hypothetical protein